MVTLKVVPAHGDAFSREVDRDALVIGRSTTADVMVADRFLSRRHARLFRSGGQWMIEDLGSRNGTFVNGRAVRAPTPVRSGDEITMSASTIRVFSEEDLQLLSSLASVAVLRIRNLELMEEAAERRRLDGEVTLARRIQLALIPETLPKIPGVDVFGRNWPSRGVSGDYYEVAERREGAECAILIVDVSGKGIAAALLTGYIEALTVALIEEGSTPAEIFARVSDRLYRRTPDELADRLDEDLEDFAAGVEFADDRTVVMVRRLP